MKTPNITMVSKEVRSTLTATDFGSYYYCIYMYKGARQQRRVNKDLKPRQVKHLMMM